MRALPLLPPGGLKGVSGGFLWGAMGYGVVDSEEQEGSRILGVSNDKGANLKRPDVIQQEKSGILKGLRVTAS